MFFDESIHDSHGFIVGAYLHTDRDAEAEVAKAFGEFGLQPGVDEFKSRLPMKDEPERQRLRRHLFRIIHMNTRIGLLITSSGQRSSLGLDAVRGLEHLILRNGLEGETGLDFFMDSGVPPGGRAILDFSRSVPALGKCYVYPEQDSKAVLGLQLADLAAHTCGQILLGDLLEAPKILASREAGSEPMELAWFLKMMLRWNFFHEEKTITEEEWEAEDRDLLALQTVKVFDCAVFVTASVNERVGAAARECFDTAYLGCTQ